MSISTADRTTILNAAKDMSQQIVQLNVDRLYLGMCSDSCSEQVDKVHLIIDVLESDNLTEFTTESDIDRMHYRLMCLLDMQIDLSDSVTVA